MRKDRCQLMGVEQEDQATMVGRFQVAFQASMVALKLMVIQADTMEGKYRMVLGHNKFPSGVPKHKAILVIQAVNMEVKEGLVILISVGKDQAIPVDMVKFQQGVLLVDKDSIHKDRFQSVVLLEKLQFTMEGKCMVLGLSNFL